jgi:gamma-glutamylcyclotransferase (GGCT)/AIG2-like uncharacterized protein YtfP
MRTNPEYLFTYGTLMSAFKNPFSAKLSEHANCIGPGSFPGKLYRISWYPGAVYQAGVQEKVYGEIYQINESANIWPELDDYEEIQKDETLSLYVRRQIPVLFPDGSTLKCWTYLYNQSTAGLPLIENGQFP